MIRKKSHHARPIARRARFQPQTIVEDLEVRVVMATDLILDFDGGNLTTGSGYIFPTSFPGPKTAWAPFASPNGAPDRTEQILQILAAVREDFAPFDVQVVWDDRGTNSPIFDAQDSVVMIVGDAAAGLYGIAASVDLMNNMGPDVGLAFGPSHLDQGPLFGNPDYTTHDVRELVDTISHEAGHNLGLSHTIEADSEERQLTTVANQNRKFDSRFSPQPLNHGGPENGVIYAETDRLIRNVGAALVPSLDRTSAQTLLQDPTSGAITVALNEPTRTRIDFVGDRDAFRFTAQASGQLAVRVEPPATGGGVRPFVTLWSQEGDFLQAAIDDPAADFSQLTFNATAGTTYWVIAGSEYDRVTGVPTFPSDPTGDVTVIVGDPISANEPPAFVAVPPQSINEGSTYVFTARAVDPNANDVLTYALAPGAPADMTIDPTTGTITWFAPRGPLQVPITVTATDDDPKSPETAEVSFVLTVNNVAPVLDNAQSGVFTFDEGLQRQLAFTDPGADSFTATVNYGDGTGTRTIDLGTNRFVDLSRPFPVEGTYNVTVSVSDGSATVSRSFTVTSVASTVTDATVTVTKNRVAFSKGISTVRVKVRPNAASAPNPNGVVRLNGTGQQATLINGRGTAVVKFKRGEKTKLNGSYDSRGTGYDSSATREVVLGGRNGRFIGYRRRG